MTSTRGFVLLNALVVVIAVAAIATAVLTLSARAVARVSEVQSDAQMALYLDGAEALIVTFLEREWVADGADHLGELWAKDDLVVPIDRGGIGVRAADLQGRLNLNALTTDDARAEAQRLFAKLGLPESLLTAVEGHLAEGGPSNVTAYISRPVPDLPRGGPARLMAELRAVPGMTGAHFETLRGVATVLPDTWSLNVNTAPPDVLAAVMPELNPAQIADILAMRTSAPFTSGIDFRTRFAERYGDALLQSVPVERFQAHSSWFEALATAELDGHRRQRRVIVYRDQRDGAVRIIQTLPVAEPVPELAE